MNDHPPPGFGSDELNRTMARNADPNAIHTRTLERAIEAVKATTTLPRNRLDPWSDGWHDCLTCALKALEALRPEAARDTRTEQP